MVDISVLDIYNCFLENALRQTKVVNDIFARRWMRYAIIIVSLMLAVLVVVVLLQQPGFRLTTFIWSLVVIGILLLAIFLVVLVISAFASWNSYLYGTERQIGSELAKLELGHPVQRDHQGFAKAMTGENHNVIANLYISTLKYLHRTYEKFGVWFFIGAFASWNYRGLMIERFLASAKTKLLSEHPEGAISDFDEALCLDPTLDTTYRDRGLAKAMMGQYHPAIVDFDKALLGYLKRGHKKRGGYKYLWMVNRVETCYISRGFCRARVSLLDEAKEDFTIALELAREAGNATLVTLVKEMLKKLEEK